MTSAKCCGSSVLAVRFRSRLFGVEVIVGAGASDVITVVVRPGPGTGDLGIGFDVRLAPVSVRMTHDVTSMRIGDHGMPCSSAPETRGLFTQAITCD